LGCVFVESIEGNYFNVVGLPAPTLYEMLLKAEAIREDRT
jgi:predicted house-cleaning NTP pyrophosphatase (Maf/HAM1 superfamily)